MKGQLMVTVRKAAAGDSTAILGCLREAFVPYRDSYTAAAYSDTVLTPESVGQRLAGMTVFVAVNESAEVVGTIGCRVTDERDGHIRGLAVRPGWHGSGVAAQLLGHAEDELLYLGCSRVTLETTAPLSRALRFYAKHGFRPSGETADFYGMPLIEYCKLL
jgi:GNAT superfamily N-acetyltransferase